jgi:cytochrome b6-f complex iron-sulfur subunit
MDRPRDWRFDEALDRLMGCSRRSLLRCGALAACAPVITQLGGCAPRIAEPVAIALDAPIGGVVSIPLSRLPELTKPGGSLLLRPDALDDLGRPMSILIVKASNSAVNTAEVNPSGLYAFDAYCPHAGCEVAWDDGVSQVVCPCHLSRFDIGGAVVNPPAREALDTYPIKLNASTQLLSINLGGSGGIFPPVVAGTVRFNLSAFPDLQTVGGAVTGRSAGAPYPLIVVRAGDTTITAFNARCPHLGCSVEGAGGILICPCHGSVFGLDGTVEAGPALTNLIALRVQFDGTHVVVTIA